MIHVEHAHSSILVSLLICACSIISGCAGLETAPATTDKAVAEAPCKADVPARPVFAGDTLTGDEDIWVIGTTLWSERLTRRAYELKLEIIAARCTASPALP